MNKKCKKSTGHARVHTHTHTTHAYIHTYIHTHTCNHLQAILSNVFGELLM